MGIGKRCYFCVILVIILPDLNAAFDDTVVVEAKPSKGTKRTAKQFLVPGPGLQNNPFVSSINGDWDRLQQQIANTGACFTSKGALGRCTPFRQCYPYFKLPELNNWDTWILGMYDTCSYYTLQGRQMFGVCCTNPVTSEEVPSTTYPSPTQPTNPPPGESIKYPLQQVEISYWPPTHAPLPTHGPNNTIPPLPTHPPSTQYTTLSTLSTSFRPTWTTKPWTQKPSQKPKPPSIKPTPKPTSPPAIGGPISQAECGAKNGYQDQERIVGGHNADINEWPWIAALFNGGRQFCGGSLIDDIHILSAAHCVAHMSSWDVARLTVRLGDHNIKTNVEVKHIEKKVKRVVRHRGFDGRTLYNDIAILTLDSPVTFTHQIRPICLPTSGSDYAGTTATVIGWGSLRESGPQPSVLQEVNIPIWRNSDCRLKYGHAAPGGIVDHMLCAGQAAKDSCSGDSGGPLMVNTGHKWTQVGIVSWGIGCGKGQYPGVYTRVEKFLPWINKNLK
ncbi:proclotting enzyme-like [Coccinella septempunctata]|uniref:proclotting enzyme-like n=1 Tax=Coccinella septempunctata TaxID=41139 RepID=UPI001D07F1F7|nr:proclotting enzyme-like [Coccinella septempunctata]